MMSDLHASLIACIDSQAIVQLSNRSWPSLCLQGDTIITLATYAYRNAMHRLEYDGNPNFPDQMLDDAVYLSNKLVAMALAYNQALLDSGYEGRLLQIGDLKLIEI
jgi:hypothetical protein